MGFNLNGYILRPARVAGGNSPDTDEATTGVERDHITPDTLSGLGYLATPTRPVEPYADMYRAAVLQKPDSQAGTEEYCVFAAVTSSLSTVDSGDSVVIEEGPSAVTPIPGTLTVGAFTDGTSTFRLTDPGGRDISAIFSLAIVSPVSGTVLVKEGEPIGFDAALSDLSVGTVVLNAAALAALGGGFSPERGDVIAAVYYILSPPTFWWSRNDSDLARFGWDGLNQRWAPLPGTTPRDMGPVIPEETYKLAPPPTRFSIGEVLPYPASADGYALLRLGLYPDSISTPLKVEVKTDTEATGSWDGSWDSTLDGVVGVTNGILLLNPNKEEDHAGKTLWYNAESFPVEGDGDMGPVNGLPLTSNQGFPVLSPIPGPTDRPFLRIGSRRYLTPVPVDTDADLPVPAGVTSGQFYWSKTTGKIVLSLVDVEKATPGEAGYELPYLGAHLYYDGLVMNQEPMPVKAPVAALDSGGNPINADIASGGVTTPLLGDLWIPRAVCMPPPGISGVQWVPDGSGDTPDLSTVSTPQTRPVGNGLKRAVEGVGDTFFFSRSFAFEKLDVDEYDDDLPTISFKVAKNKAEVSQMVGLTQPSGYTQASKVECRRNRLIDKPLYFRQCSVAPSVYSNEARIYSRFRGPYTLGVAKIRFAINTTTYEWSASVLNPTGVEAAFTAEEVRDSMMADSVPALPAGSVTVVQGRLCISAPNPADGNVEIGWNPTQNDLTGHSALGFLPGWRIENRSGETQCRWLPDNGASMGVFRSPLNRNRRESTPDIRARDSFDDTVLIEGIFSTPFVRVNPPPLEDVPGYEVDSHFQTSIGLLNVKLKNYTTTLGVGVKYDWPNQRLMWSEFGRTFPTQVPYPSANLQLANTSIFPETVSSAAMLDSSYGLYLKEADETLYSEEILGTDFLMPGQAQPGQGLLVEIEGGIVARGGGGTTGPNLAVFEDTNVADQDSLMTNVEVGYLLHILNGDAEGVYQITMKSQPAGPGGDVIFAITPPMPSDAVVSASSQWRIYEAELRSNPVVDETLVADVQLVPTNHLPDEPFKIRLLSGIGAVPPKFSTTQLTADVADAVSQGRVVSVRFGVDPDPAVVTGNIRSVVYLQRGVTLGPLASTGLFVDSTDNHFLYSTVGSDAYFQLRIGSAVFNTAAGNLEIVATPPTTVPAGMVQVVRTSPSSELGAVLIADDVVAEQGGSTVYYDQLFMRPGQVAIGTVQINPADGGVQINGPDRVNYEGQPAYFVEQMITEGSLDVTTSPMNGSVLFNKPLREGQIVEVSYYQADSNGDKKVDADGVLPEITEFLPLMVRLEDATVTSATNVYSYNPTGRTVSTVVEPFVWVGVELQNYAGRETAVIEADPALISLAEVPAEGSTVKINYGVLEAFGGEQAYTVSSPPVYRKPFFLEEDQTRFVLQTDRRADFSVGRLMVLGSTPMYIKSVSYEPFEETTEVEVWPPPQTEVGSRAVGRDARLLVSDFPVALEIDPSAPVAGGGSPGFLATLNLVDTPLLPVDKGQLEVGFLGDVRKWTRPNHLLEIDGYPYIIQTASLSADGTSTKVRVANPIYTSQGASPTVRVSTRPVYGAEPAEFNPIYPIVPTEEHGLFLMGRTDADGNPLPGKQLVEGTDYAISKPGGTITFQQPTQGPLKPGEFLHLRYTRLREVSPMMSDGALIYPLYKGAYLFMTTPTEENRLLGGTLRAKYTYRNPDSFYFSVETLQEYLGEVATASASKGGSSVGTGPMLAYPGPPDLNKKGTFGVRGETVDLGDQDRAARVYVEFFNEVIVAFEQVLEALDGRIIGDRDGKFRFFIGHDKRYAPPGWEDEITGVVNPRLIWREIIENWAPDSYEAANGFFIEADPLYNPITAEVPEPTLRPGDTDGENLDPDLRRFFIQRQKSRIKNDMEDRVLVGSRRFTAFSFIFPVFSYKGRYKSMWQDHFFSRLFPETTKHFTRLLPGLEAVEGDNGYTDPGFYSFGREIVKPGPEPGEETEQVVRTRGSTIGTVANPALGEIPNIVDITAQDRLPRARMWLYLPRGSAELDTELGTTTEGYATIVATPLPLSEFPIDPSTGFPDISQLLYDTGGGTPSGGTLDSLGTGNATLSTPAFAPGQRLYYGQPNNRVYTLTDSDEVGVCVNEVQVGCVLILASCADPTTPISGSNVFVVPSSVRLGEVVSDETGYGDTIYVGPTIGTLDLEAFDPTGASMEERAELAEVLPDYRIQFDLKVRRKRGEFVDGSLPTEEDVFPFDFQSWFGQKPPSPLSCIEGSVDFNNTESEPAQLPCLLGEPYDDSGDNQLPYLLSFSELDELGRVASLLPVIFDDNETEALPYTPDTLPVEEDQTFGAVYPDEILITDGLIPQTSSYTTHAQNAATLYTGSDVRPVDNAGSYTAGSGVGDLRRFDLLLVQTDQSASASAGGPLWRSATGILSVGEVSRTLSLPGGLTSNSIEPPRFTTPVAKGSIHRYTMRSFVGNVAETSGELGVAVTTASVGLLTETRFDFSTMTGIDLADLGNLLTGAGPNYNALVLRFYNSDPAFVGNPFIGSISFRSTVPGESIYYYNASTGVVTAQLTDAGGTGVVFVADGMTMQVATVVPDIYTVLGLASGVRYDCVLDMDTYIDSQTAAVTNLLVGTGKGSFSCRILRDRLTFNEDDLPLNKAVPRGYLPANGYTGAFVAGQTDMNTAFALHQCTVGGVFTGSPVNSPNLINDGEYFTFLERVGPDPYSTVPGGDSYVGVRSVTGQGFISVMAWEGHGNVSLSGVVENLIVSAVPSSDLGVDDVILETYGTILDGDSGLTPAATGVGAYEYEGNRNYLLDLATPLQGDTANVESGDIVVVDGQSSPDNGAVKAGTYLVRYAAGTNSESQETGAASPMGVVSVTPVRQDASVTSAVPLAQAQTKASPTSDTGCLDLSFPYIISATEGGNQITLGNVVPVAGSPNGHGWVSGTYLHLVLKEEYAAYSDDADGVGTPGWVLDKNAVWRMEIVGLGVYNTEARTLALDLDPAGLAQDASGGNPTKAEFYAAAVEGTVCSGMSYLPVGQWGEHLPENNVFGADSAFDGVTSVECYGGLSGMTIHNMNPKMQKDLLDAGGSIVAPAISSNPLLGFGLLNSVGTDAPAALTGHLIAVTPLPKNNIEFYENPDEPVYGRIYDPTANNTFGCAGVMSYLNVEYLTGAYSPITPGIWYSMHFSANSSTGPMEVFLPDFTNVSNPLIHCLMPGDRFTFGNGIDPATATSPTFFAMEGVFLEPSFPRPTQDLSTAIERVVAASYTANNVGEIGVRNVAGIIAASSERVRFFVRRIRRWHKQQDAIAESFEPLRYLYETRRGVVASYDPITRLLTADPATFGTATQLGDFTKPQVNINAGDVVRILDVEGRVVDTAEIQKVAGASTLKLRRPGLDPTFVSGGESFEVYLEQPMIPQEQSNDQLLDMVTAQELYRRVPDYDGGSTDGGKASSKNELEDPTGVALWEALGVQPDDYVVVDPAGTLFISSESGMRPRGDTACVERAAVFDPGRPFNLDDNRGFYKVVSVDENAAGDPAPGVLLVDGECKFTESGSPFGAATAEYVVLPTVTASELDPATGVEGQQDLRPTAPPVTTSVGESFEARPIGAPGDAGYKSIEPFGFRVIRPNSLFSPDAVELVLFMRERLLSWAESIRSVRDNGGSYYIFQKEDHIKFLSSDLGLLTNAEVLALVGLVNTTPFANTNECLSVLDRRFWILDFRLDGSPATPAYTQFATNGLNQRPVLNDYIEDVLNLSDLFREQRYSWISFRANREDGSIQTARRAVRTLAKRLAKARRALARQKALDES